jgi:hypothetical protein
MENEEMDVTQETTGLSRRNFLRGAAAVGMIGAMGVALTGCSDDEDEEYEDSVSTQSPSEALLPPVFRF